MDHFEHFIAMITAGLYLVVSFLSVYHAVMNKRDTKSAVGWVGIVILSPLLGSCLYFLFGINRIKRKAQGLQTGSTSTASAMRASPQTPSQETSRHATVIARIVQRPLLAGHDVRFWITPEASFENMLQSIESAQSSVYLMSYIFNYDEVGQRFVLALKKAHDQGIDVKVLVDAVGERYSKRPVTKVFKRLGIPHASFLPLRFPKQLAFTNLRNHRKLMIVDGLKAYTGGVNIRGEHKQREDLHFLIRGPVVSDLMEIFIADWCFAKSEKTTEQSWDRKVVPQIGQSLCRVIPDGPDDDFEKLRWSFLAAITSAKTSIKILTPYFLPDSTLLHNLSLAALSGVKVEVVVPEHNNIPPVTWAMLPDMAPLLEAGCHVYLSPPPFDHSKLLIVDNNWVCLGSANWDPRSLRLNFELNLEIYDAEFVQRLEEVFADKVSEAKRLTKEFLYTQPHFIRLRNQFTRLFSPYL